ncbi:MAG: PD-(D/E)XK nuclease family protein, partial [Candidatus Glassbacteria bacterium]|nr:PD-(D/E)XK nuclease family protein [Candidatus Glassbacteria bacterium]
CPMAWDGSAGGRKEQPLRFHDSRGHLTLDLGSTDREENRKLAETESLAEDLRLLYVALTRARSRCYLVWGRINESWSSAPAYLFHRPSPAEPAAAVKNLSSEQLRSDLQRVADSAGGSIALGPLPPGAGEPCPSLPDAGRRLACRRFSGRIDRSWKISSFSALASGKARETELPDRDAQAAGLEEPAPGREGPRGIFAFPRGTKAGNFFHGLLERLDFSGTDPVELEGRVDEELRLYGFDPSWKKEVCGLLQRLFSAELGRDGEKFTLGRVGLPERLNELEFYLPLNPLTPEKLREVFAAFGRGPVAESFPEKIGRLEFSPVRGFLKGFIDLVLRHGRRFYLVDWKSNYLGASVGDYRPEALAAAMQRELYTLQYHLYAVALDRYLRYRVPDYRYDINFGGVYYIFLRGVDPSRGPHYGLYYDLPPAGLVGELGRVLAEQQMDGK